MESADSKSGRGVGTSWLALGKSFSVMNGEHCSRSWETWFSYNQMICLILWGKQKIYFVLNLYTSRIVIIYNNKIFYIPHKNIRQLLNTVMMCKWDFISYRVIVNNSTRTLNFLHLNEIHTVTDFKSFVHFS